MITMLKRQSPLVAGLVVVLLTNGVALAGIAHNRGETTGTLALTARELSGPGPVFRSEENSGLALRLVWRTLWEADSLYPASPRFGSTSPAWLDSTVLRRLGFDIDSRPMSAEDQRSYKRQLAREVYFALELDGPAYLASVEALQQKALRDSAQARAARTRDSTMVNAVRTVAPRIAPREIPQDDSTLSRLFVIDVDTDLAALRSRYPDRTRYAFVRGTVRPAVVGGGPTARLLGSIDLLVRDINVPHALRGTIVPTGTGARTGQRWAQPFTMTVGFGRRLEPFILNTTATPAK
jgi:hypothetical protein